jgi:hypothetical protein
MTSVVRASLWSIARDALRSDGDRFLALLANGTDPSAMATAHWTVADTAAHVSGIAVMYVALVKDDVEMPPIPGLEEMVDATTVDTVADLNAFVLKHFTERDPQALAGLLGYAIDTILDSTRDMPPETVVTWLGDSRITVAGMVAHLVNELLLHGADMARALRRPWSIPDEHAALYWELFFLGMLRHDYGVLLNSKHRMPKRPIAVQFRSAYTMTATIVLEDGRVRLASPDEPHDVSVKFRPAGFNLFLFGRMGTLGAAVRRSVIVGGRRPWLLPAFTKIVHMPNPRLAPSVRGQGPRA